MRKLLTVSAAALALGGVVVGAAAPAEARWHGGGYYGGHGYYGGRGYYRHYHGGNGAAILGAGILGLAAGAAIASDRGYYRGGYYDYGYAPSYYAPPPYDYYGGPYCRSAWRWDGWSRTYYRVRYCD